MSERPSKRSQVALIGTSIPRSGHHFLQSLLAHYYGDDLFYCEVYARANCCNTVPCVRGGARSVTFQKSHDRQGEVRTDAGEALYIVQYREPVGEALSDRELDLNDRLGRKSINYRLSADYYSWWLSLKASYYRDFHDKWFTPKLPNAVYLDYASLAADPGRAIGDIIGRVTGDVSEERVASAIQEVSAFRAGSVHRTRKGTPFAPRKIENSPDFDRELFAAFEAYVLECCPRFEFASRLNGRFRDHPWYGLVLLHDEREPLPDGETDRLNAAAARAPEHPEVVLRLAKRALSEGQVNTAIAAVEKLLTRNPFFGPAYRLILKADREAGRSMSPEYLNGNALFACMDNSRLLGDLAQAYLDADMIVSSIAALSCAVALAPDDFRLNHLLASALSDQGVWKNAEFYALTAAKLKPGSKANNRLLSKIQNRGKSLAGADG
jgi:tetratricopeptide (TPR) repeat protein